MTLKIGSLFTGYGGLDQAVTTVTGAETVWVSDIDKGACKILAHRYPNTPNLGDITTVDWASVEPVDILTGGFPCQDVSHAGKRAGLKDGTRSGLWSHMAEAIEALKPRLVVIENVRGLLSASSPSDVEPCPWCVGDESTFDLRALGTVLSDLADIGFDARWCGLRAADVGACHGRFRVFVIAYPKGNPWRFSDRDSETPAFTYDFGHERGGRPWQGRARSSDDGSGSSVILLPTPVVNDMGEGKTPSEWSEWSEAMRQRHGNGNGHGPSLAIEALLLPTPTTRDHKDHKIRREPHRPNDVDTLSRALTQFGRYAEAVTRHEHMIGRQAPPPTEPTGKDGDPQLSPRFEEWMMGLPEGWVTDVLDRRPAMKALGNGVVPQQASAALCHLLGGF
jgi:DNA (cytosine-5)-methyltransferase 1